MADPFTLAVATAAAGRAVELTGEPVRDGVAALCRKVRERFRGRPAEEEVLEGAIASGGDDGLARLAEALRRTMADDTGFADDLTVALRNAMSEDAEFRLEVENHLSQARVETTANDDGVTNVFTGKAEKVVQVRDVHGGITIN
ncbi:hypothetical protein [Actinomadura decatromicini]|uniref:RHIM domain-containing protein n=1 Tax=Actinomadura decatromicini TaxID=2604572 RepID=A0A5D3FMQ5_9ACTN|nr:hypothetical protein [Actinomadura decatromicini]TYK49479.1 hypothetical protein FXF68_17180 [Actinomadura decatromicini]